MVLPLIPIIIIASTVLTGAGGATAGIAGGRQIKQAKSDMKRRASEYEARYERHLIKVEETNDSLRHLGESQERAQRAVIHRMRDFLERHAKQVRTHEHLIVDGVDGANQRIAGMTKLDPDLAGWVRGAVGSTIVGMAIPTAVRTGVVSFATASTGTAISGLAGAAASNATLAWLGGGALAAGGGGVALGAMMLNVAVIGPTMLIGGLTVKNRGTKAKTEAEKHRADMEIAVAQLEIRDELLRAVRSRAFEVEQVLNQLIVNASGALDILESEAFDMRHHATRLQHALILVKSVRDVATASISDEEGNLDESTERLLLTYRPISKEDH